MSTTISMTLLARTRADTQGYFVVDSTRLEPAPDCNGETQCGSDCTDTPGDDE